MDVESEALYAYGNSTPSDGEDDPDYKQARSQDFAKGGGGAFLEV